MFSSRKFCYILNLDDTLLSNVNHSLTFTHEFAKIMFKINFWSFMEYNLLREQNKQIQQISNGTGLYKQTFKFLQQHQTFNIESDRFLILTFYPNFFVKRLYQDFCIQTSLDTESKVPDCDAENCFRLLFPQLIQKIRLQQRILQRMEHILPTNFTNLILALQYRKTYQRALLMTKQKFNLKQSNIQDLTPFKTLQLYRTVVKKFYMNRTKIIEGSWFQNELRVFLWLLVGYLFIHKKQISEMDKEDWSYFTPIFHQRPAISFQFQALSLLPNSRSAKWSTGEMDLLQSIINQKKFKNKWNSIARELFIRSEKQFYRTPKQCRQRWLNYLDPNKKKTGWEHAEDLILLKTISNYGKKWSAAVRMLKNTRTEHMVKNRYKSMIATEQKKHPKQNENEILLRLIKQIEAIVYRIKIQETQKPVFSTTHIKTQYQDSSTENNNLVKQEPILPQTSSEYTQQPVPYISLIRPSFFAQNCLYPLMSFNSPSHHPNPESFLQNSSKLCSNEMNFCAQQNEFLMSQQELSNYMLFQGKQKESLMKDEEIDEKMGDDGSMGADKHEKINYFSQEFHDCFH